MTSRNTDRSIVTVTFNDGEVQEFQITAGITISQHLARETGQTGILCLWNNDQGTSIPVTSIRHWSIRPLTVHEAAQQ